MRRTTRLALPLAALLAAAGCDNGTEPETFDTGSMDFDLREFSAADADTETWAASGSCGARGFDLGAMTCAVGSDEGPYWAVLAVIAHDGGTTYDYATLYTPPQAGTCTATDDPADLCSVVLVRNTVDFPQEPVPVYLLTNGSITITEADGRATGTFEGVAYSQEPLEQLDSLVITGGTFDVDFVR